VFQEVAFLKVNMSDWDRVILILDENKQAELPGVAKKLRAELQMG